LIHKLYTLFDMNYLSPKIKKDIEFQRRLTIYAKLENFLSQEFCA
jgi:hypothetical protein